MILIMNRIYTSLLAALFLFSCTIESEELIRPFNNEDVIGSWQFFEYTYSTGGSQVTRTRVENEGITIDFFNNGKLESAGYFQCDEASYQIENDVLIVNFDCQLEPLERKYLLSWEGEKLVFFALAPTSCIEQCTHIFRKQSAS